MQKWLGLVSVLLMSAVAARAATISQMSTPLDEAVLVSGTLAEPLMESQTVDVTFSDFEFTFDQFDPSLGTLTDIRISYTFSYSVSATANSQVDDDHILTLSLNYGVSFETDGGAFDGNGTGNGTGTGTAGEALSISAGISNENSSVFWDPIVTDAQGTGTFTVSVPFLDQDWNAQIFGYFTDYEIKRDAGAYLQIVYEYTPAPQLAITTADATVSSLVDSYTVEGTNNEWAVGSLVWSNALNGAAGTTNVSGTSFSILSVPLDEGTNVISVTCTNSLAASASDTVTIIRNSGDADTDGDGMSDADEIFAGSDPDDPASVFEMTLNGDTLSWPSRTNREYFVQWCTNMVEGHWLEIGSSISGEEDETSVIINTNLPNAFFRMHVEEIPDEG